jgi:hypothetical protein
MDRSFEAIQACVSEFISVKVTLSFGPCMKADQNYKTYTRLGRGVNYSLSARA